MSGFALPRATVAASVRLADGDARRGRIYLSDRVPEHDGPESPLEMLNRAEGFFAFRPEEGGEGGTVLLISKANTLSLAVEPEAAPVDPARLEATRPVELEVVLASGQALRGRAHVELPPPHWRALDYLNASAGPFFELSGDETVHYVNRAYVLYARPLE